MTISFNLAYLSYSLAAIDKFKVKNEKFDKKALK